MTREHGRWPSHTEFQRKHGPASTSRKQPHVLPSSNMKSEHLLRLAQIGHALRTHGANLTAHLPGWARPPTTERHIDPKKYKQGRLDL